MAIFTPKYNNSEIICAIFLALSIFLFISCEKQTTQKNLEGYPLGKIIQEQAYWEGSSIEASETFFVNENDLFCLKENKQTYSGVLKIRARNGTVAALRTYIDGVPDGDFYEWHENGNLKSKQQYRNGKKHGYFYVWSTKGIVYSQRYFQDGLEDFGRFKDEGVIQSGQSLVALELKEWEGNGSQFYVNFAGDPKRGGMVWIRETEELYTGTVTALDDKGRKEAVLRFRNGKYQGTISKWDEDGKLWEEAEYDRGELVTFTIKKGQAFDPEQIIDLSEDPDMANLLFEE